MNSKEKGKRGELEFAALLRDYGFEARRGQQFSGANGDEDVVHSIPGVYIEVKRREKLNIREAMEQAVRDSKGELMPMVAHRSNRQPWLITLRAEDLLMMLSLERDLDGG